MRIERGLNWKTIENLLNHNCNRSFLLSFLGQFRSFFRWSAPPHWIWQVRIKHKANRKRTGESGESVLNTYWAFLVMWAWQVAVGCELSVRWNASFVSCNQVNQVQSIKISPVIWGCCCWAFLGRCVYVLVREMGNAGYELLAVQLELALPTNNFRESNWINNPLP